jgi:hypothetical protein
MLDPEKWQGRFSVEECKAIAKRMEQAVGGGAEVRVEQAFRPQ